MPVEMKLWRMESEGLRPLRGGVMPSEREFHDYLKRDPSLLGEPLLVIGSEVVTAFGGRLDLLAVDADANLHVLELKRDRTPREVVAQILDYGSWVSELSSEDVLDLAGRHLGQPFEAAFEGAFGQAPPDEFGSELRLTVVASALDPSSERIVSYLRTFGMPINAVFFTYLEDDDRRYLARSWLVTSEEGGSGTRGRKKPLWNGRDWYVSFGGDRNWEDARRYGFLSAGGGKFYSRTIRALPEEARVWVNVPGTGYVGVGVTTGPAQRFEDTVLATDGRDVPLHEQPLMGSYWHGGSNTDDDAEWVVPVEWLDTRSVTDAVWEKGMFANQNSACKLRQEFTLQRLSEHFDVDQ